MALHLFGTPQLFADGVPSRLTSPRAYHVLARVALLRGGRVERREFAASLWPGIDDKNASATLRREVERIEAAWRAAGNDTDLFDRSGRSIGFGAPIEIDAARFEAFFAAHRFEDAAAAYTADFFAASSDAEIVRERERLAALVQTSLQRLVMRARLEGRLSDAIACATRLQAFAAYRDFAVRDIVQQVTHATSNGEAPHLPEREHLETAAAETIGSLPSVHDSFVGRAEETERIESLLERHRLLTLTGPPGMGKTRLAAHIARRCSGAFAGGACFVDLTAAAFGEDVERIALDALAGPARALADTLESVLAARSMLLVVDNCEHVFEASRSLIAAVLRSSPHARVLATSRRPLHVPGEIEWRLAPLPVSSAVRLFLDRAEAVQPSSIFEKPLAAAEAICTMLDGVPLALELAASRLRVTTFAELESLLRDRMPVLLDPYREGRQATLDAPYALSYALLTPDARRAFRSLAVFRGGFTLEAARAICDVDDPNVSGPIEELIDRSMIVAAGGAGDGSRYKLLFSALEFGGRRLAESGESPEAGARFARYFIAKALSLAALLDGPGRERAHPQLLLEIDNIVAALHEAIDNGADLGRGLQTCVALSQFWTDACRNADGLRLIEAALPLVGSAHAYYGGAARTASVLARQLSDVERAMHYAEEACEATARSGDLRGQLQAIITLGSVYGVVGHIEGSLAAGLEGLEIARELRSPESEVYALLTVAHAHLSLGDVARARETYARAVDIGTHCGATRESLIGLNNLAMCALFENDLENAVAYADAALERARALMLPENIAWALSVRSSAAWRRGNVGEAVACSDETVEAARRTGAKILEIFLLEEIAQHLVSAGEPSLAGKLFGASDSARKHYDQPMHPIEEARRERDDAALTRSLGTFGYDAARSIGSTWSLHEAVTSALAFAKGPRDIRV